MSSLQRRSVSPWHFIFFHVAEMVMPSFTPDLLESLSSGLLQCSENLGGKRLQQCKFFLQSTTPTKYRCCVITDSRHRLLQPWSEGTDVSVLILSPIPASPRVRFHMYFSSEWMSLRLGGYVKWSNLSILTSVVLWVYGWRWEFSEDDLIKTDPDIMAPALKCYSKQEKIFIIYVFILRKEGLKQWRGEFAWKASSRLDLFVISKW